MLHGTYGKLCGNTHLLELRSLLRRVCNILRYGLLGIRVLSLRRCQTRFVYYFVDAGKAWR